MGKIAGLTGNIGSGKSYVAEIFRKMGIPVFDSDLEAKKILITDPEVSKALRVEFEDDIWDETGKPDRKKLAAIVFSDKTKIEKLNQIIHPRVRRRFESWVMEQKSPLVLQEAAILVETGAYKKMDALILVTAPEEVRIRRVIQRDHVTEKEVIKRMRNQLSEEEKLKYADYTIRNDGVTPLLPQILNIVHQLNDGNENSFSTTDQGS
jgi:dephospho-CoA kinase